MTAPDMARVRAKAGTLGFVVVLDAGAEGRGEVPRESGIYIWHSPTHAYVGQSVDLRARLAAHRRVHSDICWAAVLPVGPAFLDAEERRLVQVFEPLAEMMNIKLVRSTGARVPYDEVMASEENRPRDLSVQSGKAAAKMRKFLICEDAAQHIAHAGHVIEHAIPDFWKTEGRFWLANTLGDYGLRVTCGQQEIMTSISTRPGRVRVRLICPERLCWTAWRRVYQTRSRVSSFSAAGFARFDNWDPLRRFAIHLMRHTTPLTARSHCPQILRDPRSGL